jgi:hypothetical protein
VAVAVAPVGILVLVAPVVGDGMDQTHRLLLQEKMAQVVVAAVALLADMETLMAMVTGVDPVVVAVG